MNSQGQEATEKNEDESAMAPEIMDFKAEEQAADTPNLVNADFGKLFHHLRLLNCMMFSFQVDSYNVFVPVKLPSTICHSAATLKLKLVNFVPYYWIALSNFNLDGLLLNHEIVVKQKTKQKSTI